MFQPDPLVAQRSASNVAGKLGGESPAVDGSAEPDSFVLYRIVGNDLVPRHETGQTRNNVRFILEREPELAHCEKRWVVNRIVDPEEEAAVLALLDRHRQPYLHIPFVAEEYRRVGWDLDAFADGLLADREFLDLGDREPERAYVALCRLKNNYIMNNNGARNAALADGRRRAKWVLPWDGNCFLTAVAWEKIVTAVAAGGGSKYFVVPMQRLLDNADVLRPDFEATPLEEPQLIFRRDAPDEFNGEIPWDRRPKVELLWRLGVPGPWDQWTDDPWDRPRRPRSPDVEQVGSAGWVARLFSGVQNLEESGKNGMMRRGVARREAILNAVFDTSRRVRGAAADPCGLAFYSTAALDAARDGLHGGDMPGRIAAEIVAEAERTLGVGPWSVLDKSLVAPSGDRHDYCSPAPYWWPDPQQPDGMPYVYRDGMRAPAAELFSPESGQFDRSRLLLMFDGTTSLALGWYLTGRQDFAAHGAALVRAWFIDPATRMSPHLRYAQVRLGHNGNAGNRYGIIEFKDVYYFLDAVRLLERSGAFTEDERVRLRLWFYSYLLWLWNSDQGKEERAAKNNHGTYYDLQVAAIQSFLGDSGGLGRSFLRAMTRIRQQFTVGGQQPFEADRSITKHYVYFNLQGWLNFFRILEGSGFCEVDCSNEPYPRLAAALAEVSRLADQAWPHRQDIPFDDARLHPLLAAAARLGLIAEGAPTATGGRARFDPLSGVAPFWQLALR